MIDVSLGVGRLIRESTVTLFRMAQRGAACEAHATSAAGYDCELRIRKISSWNFPLDPTASPVSILESPFQSLKRPPASSMIGWTAAASQNV